MVNIITALWLVRDGSLILTGEGVEDIYKPGEVERSSQNRGLICMSQKIVPILKNSLRSRVLLRFELFKLQLRAERLKYFCGYSRCLTSTKSIGKFNIMKISWLQND